MDKIHFKKLLFNVAFCAMACDGHIDEREIKEIKFMDKHTSYFEDIDLSSDLNILLEELKERGKRVLDELFEKLEKSDLNTIRELLILEVALRIVNADNKLEENEINYIKMVRSKLKLHDEIIRDRFGVIDYLVNTDYSRNINTGLPDFSKIENVHFQELESSIRDKISSVSQYEEKEE